MLKTILCLTVAPVLITYYLKILQNKRIQDRKKEQEDYYYHCLFPVDNEVCRQHILDRKECGNNCAYSHLMTVVNFIGSAKKSISLCMYHLTLLQITDELIKAKRRGVTVRIITDMISYQMTHSRTVILKEKYKMPVRMPDHKNTYMHHKFCLIDEHERELAKIFFGSLNLTIQGLVCNFENIVLTNDRAIVKGFSDEFESLWSTLEK